MHTLYIAFIFGSHLLSLALAVYTTRSSGVRVEVLLYAFVIDYLFRLGTIQFLYGELKRGEASSVSALAPYVSRRPAPDQESHPLQDGEGGPPARLGSYLVVMAICAFFAFILANVDADREIRLTPGSAVEDLSWALLIAAIYWVNGLLTRVIVIHPAEPLARNLGYNTREMTILALAVLTGGLVVAYRQNAGLEQSAWAVMGPLMGFKFLYELWASLDTVPDSDAEPLPPPATLIGRINSTRPRSRTARGRR